MTSKRYDVLALGNAIVDVFASAEEDFLVKHELVKGSMALIDEPRAELLYGAMGPGKVVSGGSAANTIAGLAALGARTAYVGKVKDDQLGTIFAHDLRAQGADYATPPAPRDHPHETGRCMVLVSRDGERSMSTYLGVSEFLAPSDIDEAEMAAAEWIFLEGYRFDGPDSIAAFAKAVGAAKRAGGNCSSSRRQSVVLPVPTSPVSCTKPPPPPWPMPNSRCAKASRWRSLRYTKRGSGVIENGGSFRP